MSLLVTVLRVLTIKIISVSDQQKLNINGQLKSGVYITILGSSSRIWPDKSDREKNNGFIAVLDFRVIDI